MLAILYYAYIWVCHLSLHCNYHLLVLCTSFVENHTNTPVITATGIELWENKDPQTKPQAPSSVLWDNLALSGVLADTPGWISANRAYSWYPHYTRDRERLRKLTCYDDPQKMSSSKIKEINRVNVFLQNQGTLLMIIYCTLESINWINKLFFFCQVALSV